MTVASAISRVSYAGNGSTTVFSVPYYFLENGHLQVILSVGGVDTVQTITTNYTVTGAGNPAGGTVTMLVAPATGTQLTIVRDVPATQETDYTANDPFPAESHERALDKLTMLVQENDVRVVRAVRGPVTDSESINMILPAAVDRADGILQFDTNGAANVVSTDQFIAGLSGAIIGANYVTVSATGNGVTTAFTVSPAPGAKGNIQIYINGAYQNKATFSLAGTTVTFTQAPPLNASIEFIIGYSIGSTSGDATGIDFTQQGTGAVTRTVANKLYESVSVKDFGAIGDGVADDTAAIQAALNTGTKIGILFEGGKTYKVTSTLTWTGEKLSINSTNGIKFKLAYSSAINAFDFKGTGLAATTTLASNVNNMDKAITVTSSSGVQAGQLLKMESSASWYYDPRPLTYDSRKGEYHIVREVNGTQIIIDGMTFDEYDTGTETVTCSFYDPAELHLENFEVEYPLNTDENALVGGYYFVNSLVKNVTVKNAAKSGIAFNTFVNLIIEDCIVEGANFAGTGYAIQVYDGTNAIIKNCVMNHSRVGFDVGGKVPARYVLVDGCLVTGAIIASDGVTNFRTAGTSRGVGTHGGAEHIKFTNNFIGNVAYAVVCRGGAITIQGNKFHGYMEECVDISYGEDIHIIGNIHTPVNIREADYANYIPLYFVRTRDNFEVDGLLTISNNYCRVLDAFVRVSTANGSLQQLYVTNNRCLLNNQGAGFTVSFIQGDYSTTSNPSFTGQSHISDNDISVLQGTLDYYNNVGLWDRARYTQGLDNFVITDANALEAVTGGSLANKVLKFTVSIKDGMVIVVGKMTFDVTGSPTQIRLVNFPGAEDTVNAWGYYSDGSAAVLSAFTISTSGTFNIGGGSTSVTSTFPVGSYTYPISISYDSGFN